MAKKDLDISNPAMHFISGEKPAEQEKEVYYFETKSRRLQLLMKPSLYKLVEEEAERNHKSINATINDIVDTALRKNRG